MIMQLLNILLVLDSNVFHVTLYLVHCVLQFLFFFFSSLMSSFTIIITIIIIIIIIIIMFLWTFAV